MIVNTDATPSWSGYIFQGEVALCRAIESINNIVGPIPDDYYLRLEEDEDFSLQTNEIEVFQVKAYLDPKADKISKYKKVIEELINKYYYHKRVIADPSDGRKRIHQYYPRIRKKPIKCTLLTDKIIADFNPGLSNFEAKYSAATNFTCIQGVYTVSNIYQKLSDAIRISCANPTLTDDDIAAKVSHCCLNIAKIVKERHASKRKEKIDFKEIKQWIDAPLAFSEDLCWYEISKLFLKFLSEDLDAYDLDQADQLAEFSKIQSAIVELEKLPYKDLILLIKFYTTPHKALDKNNLRQSFGGFLEGAAVKSVVLKALRNLIEQPFYKHLQYTKISVSGEQNRYQLLNHNSEFDNSAPQQIKFQQHCEEFYKHPNTLDVDLYVTRHLTHTEEQIKSKVVNILDPNATPEELKRRLFGFITIDETINEINT
ncbi:hypothetical protein [Flavobacterium subsaxonicum]|uniref:Uncharacterized protein n=1 Tax=Flavobacterium subsaxonicum WB 4.1-42 = DSM 21790 TaxID=1121898 RepID=A0A0A2MN21_9FLAO|nr:hypothetical protein [Flavobacterium subsaxonicum]KGO93689.1 hypothetical protein Q766_06940 [Flavobacterium subsaxonicum WB 4.1-42 = DSM 21790]